MRILYLADIRFPLERANGIQTFETCHALAARGHRVTLRVRPDTAHPRRDPYAFYGLSPLANLRIETVGAAVGPPVAKRAVYVGSSCLRALRGRWDVLLTRDLGMAAAIARVPRGRRPALVYESHGFSPEVSAALSAMLSDGRAPTRAKQDRLLDRERIVWQRADGYITITQALHDELTDRFGERDRIAVVHDGVRIDRLQPIGRRGARPVVGYAGHLYPWKGVDVLLEALARIPDVHGLIVGGHPSELDLERCRGRAAELAIADRITFTGLVAPFEVGARIASADVLVLPNLPLRISRAYTSPLKLFEYMAAGRPIVASDLPAVREVVGVDAAVLVKPGDPEALAAGLRRVLANPDLAERLARTALARVRDFTWDARAARIETLLAQFDGARPS
jgi:glycosyltransferase involved in cell wall biosynthesis